MQYNYFSPVSYSTTGHLSSSKSHLILVDDYSLETSICSRKLNQIFGPSVFQYQRLHQQLHLVSLTTCSFCFPKLQEEPVEDLELEEEHELDEALLFCLLRDSLRLLLLFGSGCRNLSITCRIVECLRLKGLVYMMITR